MSNTNCKNSRLSRRDLLKTAGFATLLLRPAPLFGASFLTGGLPPELLSGALSGAHWPGSAKTGMDAQSAFPFTDVRFKPHYPEKSPLADILRFVTPGSDGYITEKYAVEVEAILKAWGQALRVSPGNVSALAPALSATLTASPLRPIQEVAVRSGFGIDVTKRLVGPVAPCGREQFLRELAAWLGSVERVETTEFAVYGIKPVSTEPLTYQLKIRYDLLTTRRDGHREERIGSWQGDWTRDPTGAWKAQSWETGEETRTVASGGAFNDITWPSLGGTDSYRRQMIHGADYWRTVMDGACGMDLYANNGVAAGDYDNDGFDDLYVCQTSGLPNRLYRNRGDGSFEDVTDKAGVGVLDSTACALFADFENRGLQDLLVVCSNGPLLFANQGDGTFALRRDAFKFAKPPEGSFTHAAIADYDGDGRLDIYFCMYMYYLGLDQYHYPIPYYDARNGPPNCLMHNEGNGKFVEKTEEAGLNIENNRYSFACVWGASRRDGPQDLCIANDFGSSQLYGNNGDGTFTIRSKESHIDGVGAGMSACWSDFNNDGLQDIYVTSMWEAAGQRVSEQPQFHPHVSERIRNLYQRHARGNALYENQGDGTFKNVGKQADAMMGGWSWSTDVWDFDHDGFSDLYIANGYISAVEREDIESFFWRQVVGNSPEDATPSLKYEHAWNASNELIRSDHSWNAYERNVLLANNRDGTFSEASGVVGMDFLEDGRSFALADIDKDGRLEVILKSRNAPQLRVLHNDMTKIGGSIVFRLRGHKSNRDAIGTAITLQSGELRQTKYLQAGSGFLAQHSKEVFFGLGRHDGEVTARIHWPSGLTQTFASLPANHRIEIEEGKDSFVAKAFAATPASYAHAEPLPASEHLPTKVETWLAIPLQAPEFSLPDMAGEMQDLKQFRGRYVLLNLWSMAAPSSREQLRALQRHRAELTANHLEVLAVNLEEATDQPKAKSWVTEEKFSFPVLFATEEMGGIYNIIYRYLFDRHRDLGFPTSFLLDGDGRIIKVYQGPIGAERVIGDAASAPRSAAERVERAIPFKGQLYNGAFQRNDFTYGVALFQYGYLEEATVAFQQVIAAKPDDPEGYYNLGTLSLRRDDFPQARAYLKKALQLQPNYPEAWNNLGMMSAQEGDADLAIANFQQALRLRPGYEIAMLNLGNVYRRERAYAKAKEYLDQALAAQPDDPEVNYSLGMLCAQQNQLADASAYLQKAIALRPAYPDALNNLGIVYVQLQEPEKAEEQFKMGIRLAPNNDDAYMNLARFYVMQGRKEKALEVMQELLQVQPQNQAARHAVNLLRSAPQ